MPPGISNSDKTVAPPPGSQFASLDSLSGSSQPHLTPNQRAWRRFGRNRPAVISAWLLSAILLLVIAWPICLNLAAFAGPRGVAFSKDFQPEKLSEEQFHPPSAKHWFGTDVHGRDLLSRVLY